MKRNLVIFVIIIVLFFLLALIGFAIYWAQNGFRRRGGASETSGEEG
jgi:ABC-type transporter Mla subunit MlaD